MRSKQEEEQSAASDALDGMSNPCRYGFSHFLRHALLLNTPLLQLVELQRV